MHPAVKTVGKRLWKKLPVRQTRRSLPNHQLNGREMPEESNQAIGSVARAAIDGTLTGRFQSHVMAGTAEESTIPARTSLCSCQSGLLAVWALASLSRPYLIQPRANRFLPGKKCPGLLATSCQVRS